MGEGNRIARAMRMQAIRRKTQQTRFARWPFGRGADGDSLQWRREHWMLAGSAVLVLAISGFFLPAWASAMLPSAKPVAHQLLPLTLPAPAPAKPVAPIEDWRTVRVRPGQTLSDIFQDQGLGLGDLQRVIDAAGGARGVFHNIRPGQEFDFLIAGDGSLRGIRFDKDDANRAVIRFDRGAPTMALQPRQLEQREHIAHGTITSSLYASAAKAGMSAGMVVKLADLFKYDVDFVQDLREGDSFTVVYDDVYRDGSYFGEGDIVAAEFVNRGHRYTAYRFKKSDGQYGWFSEDGRPIQKSFLRIPVDFTRISSRFSTARMHPILGRMRAHKGVDYAAPRGTPIHAAGDGVIKYRGWVRGFGNFVLIQHNNRISTAYGHMSRFAREHVGERVRQGQVIGYVGMTGLATGPHLHYEFRVNGVQRDPQTVTLPKPNPLPAGELARFERQVVRPQLARLQAVDANVKLAQLGANAKRNDG